MKRLLLGVIAVVCSTLAYSQATEIIVETYAENIGDLGTVDLTGYNTYRVYVKFTNPNDFLTAVYGDADYPTRIRGGNNFYHSVLGGMTNESYQSLLFPVYPDLEYDSFVTIGMTAPANLSSGEALINSVGDPNNNWIPQFDPLTGAAGSDIIIQTQTGGSWFPLFPNSNAYAGDDLQVLIGQFTTDTVLYGVVSVATFVNGIQPPSNQPVTPVTLPFSSIPDAVFGCTDGDASNFDPAANEDNGTCVYACDYPGTQLVVTATSSQDVSCSGTANGFASITVSGGQGSLSFTNGIVTNATGLFFNQVAGNVTMTVTDGQGCQTQATVTVGSPAPLNVMASLSDPISCAGQADAVLSGSSTGGTGSVTYSLSAPMDTGSGPYFANGVDILLFENIGAGLYTVWGIDENGCVDNTPGINVSAPLPFNVYAQAVVPTSCPNSSDGTVVLNFYGGSGNSTTYSQNGVTYTSEETFNVSPGTYTFYGQDVNGCVDTLYNVVVGTPPSFVAQSDLTSPSCFGTMDGAITVEVQGGTGEIEYVYDGDTTTALMLSMVGAGVYDIVAVDGNGCSYDASVELTQPAEIVPTAVVSDVLCSDSEDGVIVVTGNGGTGMGYIYSIDGGGFGPSSTFDDLTPGDYTITVQDDAECAGSATFTVEAPDAITITVDANNGSDPSLNNGVIDITVSGGVSPYTFSWDGPGYDGTDEDATGIAPGDYTVTITDANGCEFTSATITVVVSGVEEMVNAIVLTLFPNPTRGQVELGLDGLVGESVTTILTDGLGREVVREDLGNLNGQFVHRMDLSSYESGVYFLRVQVDQASRVLRVVKQ